MELCTLLAPVAALMLQHREPRMLEEATRALRWLLIEPEDPSVPAPAGGAVHMLPSKVRTITTLCCRENQELFAPSSPRTFINPLRFTASLQTTRSSVNARAHLTSTSRHEIFSCGPPVSSTPSSTPLHLL